MLSLLRLCDFASTSRHWLLVSVYCKGLLVEYRMLGSSARLICHFLYTPGPCCLCTTFEGLGFSLLSLFLGELGE